MLLAGTGVLSACIWMYLKGTEFRKWMVPANVGASTLSIAVAVIATNSLLALTGIDAKSSDTNALVPTLCLLTLGNFVSASIIRVPLSTNFGKLPVWTIWEKELFPVSITQIAAASVAFITYKVIFDSTFLTTSIALLILGIAYINYRRTIADINESIEQAEKAEREKAEIAAQKAEEAQDHANELAILLKKEEEISADLQQSKDELEYSAYHDALTDLPNRPYLMERLRFLIELGMEKSSGYYIVFLDLNRFKNINDSLGHSIGDQVLKIVALRLRRLLRDEDSIARLGGDEFAVILTNLKSIEKAYKVATKLYESLTRPFTINGNVIHSDLHIGIAPLDFEHVKPADAIRDADIAMQNAKDNNAGIAIFDKSMRSRHLDRIRLESDLYRAVEREELSMHYQPLVSLEDGSLVGFEALLRWIHPELGFVSPAEFIPISEESGSIIPITKWILKETCTQISRWNKSLDKDKQIFVSVNISGKHLAEEELVRDVRQALRISGLTPEYLKLEITESAAMENAEKSVQILQNLKALGVQLSIDDFGTGYSSLSYLHRLPFDTLKIDRSFVEAADTGDQDDLKILETIVSLTKSLGRKLVAEGIETEDQLKLLQNLECDFGQGYLFSKPRPVDEISPLLIDQTPWLELGELENPMAGSSEITVDEGLRPF